MTPLWDQRDKNFRNRDLKPKLSDEMGKKLKVAGKYWNNNTNEIGYYCLAMYARTNVGLLCFVGSGSNVAAA